MGDMVSARPHCLAAFAHRHGGSVTVCRVQWRGSSPGLVRMGSFRLPSAFVSTPRLAIGWSSNTALTGRPSISDVRFAAWSKTGGITILQLVRSEIHGRHVMAPTFEVDTTKHAEDETGQLVFADSTLYSLRPRATTQPTVDHRLSTTSARLRVWDLDSGQSWRAPDASWSSLERIGLDNMLGKLCGARGRTAELVRD